MASKAPSPPSQPAGVPSGGSTKFVVAAVALVGLIAAAVAWKKCQAPEGPAVVYVDAGRPETGPITTGRNPDDDVPPPPPVVDAGEGGKKTPTQTGLASGCDSRKCTGTATSDLETALQFRVKQAHRCYDNALAQDPTLRGKVTVAVRVGGNGQTCSAGIASNEMGSSTVATCVAGNFRNASFPAPKGGCVDINIPINYVPRQ